MGTARKSRRRVAAGSAVSVLMTAGLWSGFATPASALTNEQVIYLPKLCHQTGGTWVATRHPDGSYSFRCEYGRSATSPPGATRAR